MGVLIDVGNHFPENLIIEILSWLPARTLLQFKTVCKQWYSIIKSPHFISKQLRNYYDNNDNWRDCLIMQYCVTVAGELNVYEFLFDDTSKEILAYQEVLTPEYNTAICGPCDGIYFLWEFDYSGRGRGRSLWNPTLNEFKVLPRINLNPNLPSYMTMTCETYGFGYDSDINDYKVIIIQSYRNKNIRDFEMIDYPMSIYVYSLRNNSWRYVGDLKNSYYFKERNSYDFVNGCYYWLASSQSDGWHCEVVISFDVVTDVCEEFRLPKFEHMPSYGSQLVVYHDSIGFVLVPECGTMFDVWILKDGGAWTRKLTVEVGFRVWGAFCHWCDNMFLFRKAGGKLVMCD
ncbi:hypothetical protein RND81_07G186400 [Saponaria officinalis]|uniref:F-box domain-containing protein n=1 Tax=Saponaria officinalis TaxID=3572 RepID=A0AAW1JPY7_SAPOF